LYLPGVPGASIGTETSTVPPGGTLPAVTGEVSGASIWSPWSKTTRKSEVQVHVPTLRNRQVLVNVSYA
jgi:hypothetical protein